ncbi:MAG: class I SAM-dependent methyltransferase, partial [Rhodoluna sp.]
MPRKPIGVITRGTTNPNRLRRVDRFIANHPVMRAVDTPLVVDLGFGAYPTTTIELLSRLEKVNPKTSVVGIEIDRERVANAVQFQ